ncbi:hypothetical protein SAMN02983009_01004 [Fusobacterium necrophorum]|uniref:autotransporter-associated N-terminal domain-containing protein n=1 Tax=Fusobacterium necrophorum TaxID=859 RepID=UPI0008810F04|nr:autotransporter-associated N-terminal domain-containing protein [Fusobacterium necrophorum]SDB20827.1 hypothetical protein SAMN02983009_01004 [Fusobacterium necrophorum]
MKNQRKEVERTLRYIAKRNKSISFSIGLVLLYLMLGMNAFAESPKYGGGKKLAKSNINASADQLSQLLQKIKVENEKKVKNTNLELIQLMEQGDQVVKSPWSSWQFGLNYIYENGGEYFKGRGNGDKDKKYPYEGILARSIDVYERYTSPQSAKYLELSTGTDIKSATTTNRNGLKDVYGLANTKVLQEKPLKFEVSAGIRPIQVSKGEIKLAEKTPQIPNLPEVATFTFSPITVNSITVTSSSPTVSVATVSKTAPEAPNVSANTPTAPTTAKFEVPNPSISSVSVKVQPVFVQAKKISKGAVNIEAPTMNVVTVTPLNIPNEPTAPTLPNIKIATFNPVAPKVEKPKLTTPPTFNIQLGSYRNHMTQHFFQDGDGGRFRGAGFSIKNDNKINKIDANTTGITDGHPTIVSAWATPSQYIDGSKSDSALLKVYFDVTQNVGTVTVDRDLTIDSISDLTEEEKTIERNKNRTWNLQDFLIGGSRVATLDNAHNTTIKNAKTINLVGPLVVGYEIQNDNVGTGTRAIENTGTITDEAESKKENIGVLTLSGNEVNLTLSPHLGGGKSIKISRTSEGYIGYKVGMILTYEYDDKNSSNYYKFLNDTNGTIKFSGKNSIGIQIYAPEAESQIITQNKGVITMGGIESYGLKLSSRVSSNLTFENSENGTINISGDKSKDNVEKESLSSGIAVLEDSSLTGNRSIRAYTGKVLNKGTINVSGGQGNTGMVLKVNAADDITNKKTINVSGSSNIGMRVDKGEVSTDATGTPKAKNDGTININGGTTATKNMGMVANGESEATNETAGKITLKNTGIGLLSTNSGTVDNKGTISGENLDLAIGISVLANSKGTNTGTMKLSGTGVTGVYNEAGTFNMTGGSLEVSGDKSLGIYSKGNSTTTNLSGGTITASNGTVGLYADDSTMKLSGSVKLISGKDGLMFYNYSSTNNNPSGKFNLSGDIKGEVKSDGTAFYFKGGLSGITSFLNSMFDHGTSTGQLKLKLNDGATLFVLDNPGTGTPIQLSSAETTGIGSTLGSKVILETPTTKYKAYSVFKGALEIDQNVDLSFNTDAFYKVEFISSNVKINNGMTLSGSSMANGANYIIGQKNYSGATDSSSINISNAGEINFTGNKTTALLADFGKVTNETSGKVKMTGSENIGLLGASNSILDNKGGIEMGTKGVGIWGVNQLATSTDWSNKNINITNTGTIKGTSGSSSVLGIYANNTSSSVSVGNSKVDHSGDIDLSGSTQSIGINSNKSTITSSGKISVNEGSIGINAVSSPTKVTGGTYTLGKESVGFKLSGTGTTFTGTGGSIAITGEDSVAYQIDGIILETGGTTNKFTDDLSLTSTGKYTYINLQKNANLTYNNSNAKTLVADNSIFINAQNSTVNLGSNVDLSSTHKSVVGVYAKETATGTRSISNGGKISLTGDSSVGLYGVNQSTGNLSLTNNGTIIIGDKGAGLYTKKASASNKGTITVGSSSTGMSTEDGQLSNDTGAKMISTGTKAMGITQKAGGNISNAGEIRLTGDKSIGMLSTAITTTGHVVSNTGTITVGDSTNSTEPSIGIYNGNSSTNSKVENSGKITAGTESIGIYAKNINLTGNSEISAGKGGIAVYSNEGTVDISSASKLSVGDSLGSGREGIAVYLAGNSQTLNSKTLNLTIGTGSFGYGVTGKGNTVTLGTSGTAATVTLGQNSTYLYSIDETGNITNYNKLTSTGDKNSGIYSAGTVTNEGEINFNSSTGSVAIQSIENGTATNEATITVGKSVTTGSEAYSIGMSAGVSGTSKTKGNVVNAGTGVITINNDNSLGMYGTETGSTGTNKGNINVAATGGKNVVGMYADKNSVMTNENKINMASTITTAPTGTPQAYNFGMISSNGGIVKNTSTGTNTGITLLGPYTIGMMSDKSKIENSGKITGASVTNSIGIAGIAASNVTNSGEVSLTGKNSTGLFLNGANTTGKTEGTSKITLLGDNSIGIFVDNAANLNSYAGETKLTGKGVYGIVLDNGGKLVSSGGKLEVGTSASPAGETTQGSMAIGVMRNNSEMSGKLDVTAHLAGKNSIGIYSKGKVIVNKADITTANGAVNFYADGGTIKVGSGGGTSTTETGIGNAGSQGSLLFYTKNNGKIEIANTMNAKIKGDSNAALRGTAFLYNGPTLSGTNTVSNWLNNTFINNGLSKLSLNMEDNSRLVLVNGTGHTVKLSELKASALGIGTITTTTNYKSFTMSKSTLDIDENANLDGNTDYTRLELLNSSITNNANITGSQDNQYAMAQETDTTVFGASQSNVVLTNKGNINLSGATSVAMYTKYGTLTNDSNGKMNISGKDSTAMFGLNDSKLTNAGVINISNKSTGMYYSDVTTLQIFDTKESLKNAGMIKITEGNKSVGMAYEPGKIGSNTVTFENNGTIQMTVANGEKNVGMFAKNSKDSKSYNVKNTGTIEMTDATLTKDANIGIYTEDKNKVENSGKITIGRNSIGIFGYGVANSGDITVGENGIGIFSKGKNVTLTDGIITAADSTSAAQAAVGIYLSGSGQTLTNSGTKFDLGKNTFGIINTNATGGNTIDSTTSSVTLAKEGATYIYSTDTNGTVNNATKLTASASKNTGIYSAGTVKNAGDIDFNSATGSIGIQSISNGTATNNATITVGKSGKANNLYSIGMSAGIKQHVGATRGKVVNSATGRIKVNNSNSLGMYSTEIGSTGENLGTIETSTSGTTAMFADNSSIMTNKNKIKVNSTMANVMSYNFGMSSSGTNSEVINDTTGLISLTGKYGIGMYSNGSKATNDGTITSTSANNVIGMHSATNTVGVASALKNTGRINLTGSDNVGISLTGAGTTGTTTGSSKVTLSGDNSTGISVAKGSALTADAGTTTVKGNGAYGIVVDDNAASTMSSTGKLTVSGATGSAGESSTRGSVGIAVMNTAATGLTGSLDATIHVTGGKSVGLYSKGNLIVDEANVTTSNGATNFFADGGKITVGNASGVSNVVTGTGSKGSLLFYATGAGKININGRMNATIEGGANAATRGTAFYYNGSSGVDFTTWLNNTFSGLNNLHLMMNIGSRLIAAQGLTVDLSNTGISTIFPTSVIGSISGTDYKTFMLHRSNLTVDQAVNLDNSGDAYNNLEIAGSSITNNNTITGTKDAQTAMAQKTDGKNVVLTNTGTINLSGKESTAMYTKKTDASTGTLTNSGTINVGDKSTAMYGINNVVFSNTGTINIGSDSTAMYYTDKEGSTVYNTTTGLSNAGIITSSGNNSMAMSYQDGNITGTPIFENTSTGTITMTGDKNIGMYALKANAGSYTTKNSGTITLGNSTELNNPNVAIYTNSATVGTNPIENTATITVGNNAIGIYGNEVNQSGNIMTGDNGVGIYSQRGEINLTGGTIKVGGKEAVGVYTSGIETRMIKNSGTSFDIGDTSFGFVNIGNGGNTIESKTTNITLSGNDSVYVYSNDNTSTVNNHSAITSTGATGGNYGIISAGTVNNDGNMTLTQGIGNVGIYSNGSGIATNSANIRVGASDPDNQKYSIGMAAGYKNDEDTTNPATTGNVLNKGKISVDGKFGIGMYATNGSTVETTVGSKIELNADNTIGIYLDEGARGVNHGEIKTGSSGLSNVIGVYLGRGTKLDNYGKIEIEATNGAGAYLKGGTIANYGTLKATGAGAKDIYTYGNDMSKPGFGEVEIIAKPGATKATIKIDGKEVSPKVAVTNIIEAPKTVSASSIGMYVNTSGTSFTRPIENIDKLTEEADLIIGTEASQNTNSRYLEISDPKILKAYNKVIASGKVKNWNIYSGGLTWTATATLDPITGEVQKLYLAKASYTNWAGDKNTTRDTYNFADGLEQRYGIEKLGTKENRVFEKLNTIGNNEEILLHQAYDEMMGHQYANLQQRIHATGQILDKEFKYLKEEWRTASKDSNKIKVFGMNGEYSTDSAGIIDYKNNAYGVAYVGEKETFRLGNTTGWYTGLVHNEFKFKDIGRSKEEMLEAKLGVFHSKAFDENNRLNWTISGEGFVGYNKMNRRFFVVEEVFHARAKYWSYGLALENELSKTLRWSENFSLRGYGSVKVEYGRFQKIKEKTGEVRLEVKSNDYLSIKPEIGGEFIHKTSLSGRNFLSTKLGIAYENELGRVANGKNQARVAYTSADWFHLRGEKEDRRGNLKTDLKIGLDNERYGITANIGYDSKGKNKRVGLGLRVVF